jgi:hypothetical protein
MPMDYDDLLQLLQFSLDSLIESVGVNMPSRSMNELIEYVIENQNDALSLAIIEETTVTLHLETCDNCENWCRDTTRMSDTGRAFCSDCLDDVYCDDNGDYYEEEPEEDIIPEYHSEDFCIPYARKRMKDVLGVELETYQPNLVECRDFMEGNLTNQGWKYERDGSLDDDYGVEIVAPPYTLREIRREDSLWKKALSKFKDFGAACWDAGTNYGMHISLNAGMMSRLHRAKIVRFINENEELCTKLAGRKPNQWMCYHKFDKLSNCWRETDKYLGAANRGSRIEIRIFRGSLCETRFIRNCEFADAVRVFCESASCTEQGLSQSMFMEWLSQPQNRTNYPLLADLLGVSMKKPLPETVEV